MGIQFNEVNKSVSLRQQMGSPRTLSHHSNGHHMCAFLTLLFVLIFIRYVYNYKAVYNYKVNLFKRRVYLPAAKYISNCVLKSLLPMIWRASFNVRRSLSHSSILYFSNIIATSSPVFNSES